MKLISRYASVIIFIILTASSALSSIGSYRTTRSLIVSDLNRALTITLAERQHQWLTTDTIRAYRNLQGAMGGQLSIDTRDATFCQNLTIEGLRDMAYVRLDIHDGRKSETEKHAETSEELCSDTMTCHTGLPGINVDARSYAGCSAAAVFSMSDQRMPATLLIAAMLWAMGVVAYNKQRRIATSSLTTYGGIALSADGNDFINTDGRNLRLTPMQHQLLTMFFCSPSHTLTKQEICDGLWPNKDDANATLYTLIRRLKPVLEADSRLRIESDRGRAYRLTVGNDDQ